MQAAPTSGARAENRAIKLSICRMWLGSIAVQDWRRPRLNYLILGPRETQCWTDAPQGTRHRSRKAVFQVEGRHGLMQFDNIPASQSVGHAPASRQRDSWPHAFFRRGECCPSLSPVLSIRPEAAPEDNCTKVSAILWYQTDHVLPATPLPATFQPVRRSPK